VKSALGSAKPPELLNSNELKYERVAAARPDLILYLNSRNEEPVYRKLADIAPTIASDTSVKNVYGVRWQDQLATIGKALGRSDRAGHLQNQTERLITDAKAANPQFAGKAITAGVYTSDSIWVWFPSDPRMRLLQQLGFVVNEKIAAKDDGNFTLQVSDEQLELLESDLIFLAALDAAGKVDPGVSGNKVFQALDTVRGGHAVYWPGPATINTNTEAGAFSSAFSIGGPLGIAACLPKLVEMVSTGLRA
jgi:iron complex transport system substrate-binding protein